ncbi:hypothetical protein SteCoe_1545 [Stentor coeruleus]|uniref:Uncharacterized protein n=1 Tax=Stentor coeruleus TaxID=5963 RepID=A0A1R2D1M2_9CILI|nr:hypothetical protein SteCoe_1545 [Stentor coeruleus]
METLDKKASHNKFSLSQNSQQSNYADFLNTELKHLQDKILTLECRMNTRDTPFKDTESYHHSKGSSKSRKKCEKELKSLESSIGIRSNSLTAMQVRDNSKDLSKNLVKLRQNNAGFIKDNEKLRKQIKFKRSLEEKARALKEDYKGLKTSIKRSENIRKKQKAMIDQLKNQLEQIKSKKSIKKKIKKKDKTQ